MIIALAGRRIDAAGAAEHRFPLENVALVRGRVRSLFDAEKATALVSSVACGADLIALSEATSLALRRRVVLPFERERFRKTSVTDRPGDWGPLYDEMINDAEASGDLVVVAPAPDDEAYSAANHVILDQAMALAEELGEPAAAVLAWDGTSRGDHDITEAFGTEARKRGLRVIEVKTI